MNKHTWAVVAIFVAVLLFEGWQQRDPAGDITGTTSVHAAFANKASNIQITGQGRVMRVLSDDEDGSRHQRFILDLGHGLRVLVAHNIDLAPRVKRIKEGDQVEFYGEYEWTKKGGVVHWTHHDPARRHVAGWLKHQGKQYQ